MTDPVKAADGPPCSCGGRFPTRHLHADVHEPVDEPARTTPNNAEQLAATILRVQALADEYVVAIPTHLIDAALDQTAHGPAATGATKEQP